MRGPAAASAVPAWPCPSGHCFSMVTAHGLALIPRDASTASYPQGMTQWTWIPIGERVYTRLSPRLEPEHQDARHSSLLGRVAVTQWELPTPFCQRSTRKWAAPYLHSRSVQRPVSRRCATAFGTTGRATYRRPPLCGHTSSAVGQSFGLCAIVARTPGSAEEADERPCATLCLSHW